MTRFLVVARADGRGGFRPFGTYSARQAGASVKIGARSFKVGVDGRVNIPKSIMDEYGIIGADGRRRVSIQFSRAEGVEGWKDVAAEVGTPGARYSEFETGAPVFERPAPESRIRLEDFGDYTWSP